MEESSSVFRICTIRHSFAVLGAQPEMAIVIASRSLFASSGMAHPRMSPAVTPFV